MNDSEFFEKLFGVLTVFDKQISSVISGQFLNTLKKNGKNKNAEQKMKRPRKKKKTLKLPKSMVSALLMETKKKLVIFGSNLQAFLRI